MRFTALILTLLAAAMVLVAAACGNGEGAGSDGSGDGDAGASHGDAGDHDAAGPYDKPGFTVSEEQVAGSTVLWVLKEGQARSEDHVTLEGAAPNGGDLCAVDTPTALAYLAAKPGWRIEIETVGDSHVVWVLRPGQRRGDHSYTAPGRGPHDTTLRAADRETAMDYLGIPH